jgi:predicted Zn finger-like uncharacterized protein
MQIIIQCPHCAHRWWVAAEAADRRLRCRRCSTLFKVPALTEVPNATKVIIRAGGHLYVDDTGRTYG